VKRQVSQPGNESEESSYKALKRELVTLRQGPGIARISKLAEAETLRSALARKAQKANSTQPRQLSPSEAAELFRQELDDLGEDLWAQATRNAYAIGRERNAGDLTDRRGDFAKTHEIHPDTVKNYEDQGIEELARRLEDFLPRPRQE
jgi:hypothetical protein